MTRPLCEDTQYGLNNKRYICIRPKDHDGVHRSIGAQLDDVTEWPSETTADDQRNELAQLIADTLDVGNGNQPARQDFELADILLAAGYRKDTK